MRRTSNESEKVENYADIYKPGLSAEITLIKIRIIQEMIQIDRPKNWNNERMMSVINDLINVEKRSHHKS